MRKVEKPWGHEIIWAETANYVGKLLHINAGHRLSLQFHRVKEETVYVVSGTLYIYDGDGGITCLLYTSPSPRDQRGSRMPSSA